MNDLNQIRDDLKEVNHSVKRFEQRVDDLKETTNALQDLFLKNQEILRIQTLTLEEIRNSADSRKRDSENSIREIKNQMTEMSIDNSENKSDILTAIEFKIEAFNKINESNTNKLVKSFDGKFRSLNKKVNFLYLWIFVLTALFVLFR